jgi:hypothetical protein
MGSWNRSGQRTTKKFHFISAEGAANIEAAEEWKSKLQNVMSEYPPENQFSADETGLFIDGYPENAWFRMGENVKADNFPKKDEVYFCAVVFVTGEKLKPVVIGNSIRPRVFRGQHVDIKHLPVTWCSNRKVWIATAVFEEQLTDLNQMIKKIGKS